MYIEGGDLADVSMFRKFHPGQVDPATEMSDKEKYDKRFWQEGTVGNCNIVCYDGDDISPVAFIDNAQTRRYLINRHNRIVRELIKQADNKVE